MEETNKQEEDQKDLDYQKILDHVYILAEDYSYKMEQFGSDSYNSSFEEYTKKGISILLPAEQYATISEENKDKVVKDITKTLYNEFDRDIGNKKSLVKDKAVIQYRLFLICYMIPMIRHIDYSFSEALADRIVTTWNSHYPKNPLQKTSYHQIQSGFTRKGLCFVTTAVCNTLKKPDDCYELNSFRNFRDTYMLNTVENKKLVEGYYRIAPVIVTMINLQPDHDEIYMDIWNKYLKGCLNDIEQDRPEECEKRYIRMVHKLKKQYYM